MKIKSFSLYILAFLLLCSCSKKDEILDIDLSAYNSDNYVATELDDWLLETFVNPYNIEVVYRFDRNLTEVSKDISPVKYTQVEPFMTAVLKAYLKAYEKVAGATFIKKYSPKQFVLYGSPEYNSDGSVTLGTAEGGRKIVLYELNGIDFDNPDMSFTGSNTVRRRLRTIHHEFTHILNQTVAIPSSFEQISKADYESDWTNTTANPESTSRSLGFISRYARSAYTEDFAETVAHLLVQGQLWYDQYALASGEDAYTKMKQKEALVVDYFLQYFSIDFRELQYEVQRVLKDDYNDVQNQSFAYWLNQGDVFSSLTFDPNAEVFDTYGQSANFTEIYQNAVSAVAAVGSAGRSLNYMRFDITNTNELEVVLGYNNTAGTHYEANFSFTMSVNTSTGEALFTKIEQRGTTGVYSNATTIAAGILPIQNFLTGNTFVADWLPFGASASDWQHLGGFYVQNNPESYFYGELGYKY
ncbi:substrate import-associated zinc metallohydrolase lipoprotein [Sphingobacterium sp. LRF_L2]|uniref:substrate import-associated zinc metallohydrolase lipoprotein n=1 Tax=Sphingobacterium sp. LRF_L2 TaxID=3369421 RepID=UPI003F60BEE2